MREPNHNGYLAVPESRSGPGVLVLHAWWGLTDFIRQFCDRLAQAGFVALAPDLYSGKTARTVPEAEQWMSSWDEEHEAPPLIRSAVEELRHNPAVRAESLGVIGFSMGGYWTLWLTEEQPELFRAAVIFYATDGGTIDFQQSQAAYLGNFAAHDPYESAEAVQSLEKRLRQAGRPAQFYTYPGVGHWFMESDRPDAYDPPAAGLAWDQMVNFLHENLG